MSEGQIHADCLMKEEWAKLQEHFTNFEDRIGNYMLSQAEINNNQTALISKLSHKIYGNAQNGMDTTIKLNKQTASSETAAIASSMKRLWWLMVVVSGTMIGNLVTVIFLALRKSI